MATGSPGSMANGTAMANLFELTGNGTHLTYSTSSINGQPQLHYHDATYDTNFTGDQIRVVDSEIGQLVSVTLRPSVDAGGTVLTLLLPEITLDGPTTTFQTHAIITTIHRLVVAPSLVKGPHQSYHFVALDGTAKAVDF